MNRSILIYDIFRTVVCGSSKKYLVTALAVCAICMPRITYASSLQTPGDQSDKSPVQGLLDELDDIDYVRSLTPLKLTVDQIDKLVAAITDAKTQYDKKIADLSASTVGAMAEEIHKRHKEAVAGGPVSATFDTKVKRMLADFFARREVVNHDNLVSMTTAIGKILTADQKKIAAQLEKDTLVKLKKDDPSNDVTQYFNLYVVDMFIGYRRIVPLLKDMKPSA